MESANIKYSSNSSSSNSSMKLTTEATLSKDKATNTMLVTTIRMNNTVQLKMCQKCPSVHKNAGTIEAHRA